MDIKDLAPVIRVIVDSTIRHREAEGGAKVALYEHGYYQALLDIENLLSGTLGLDDYVSRQVDNLVHYARSVEGPVPGRSEEEAEE